MSRLIYGFAVPIVAEVLGALLIMSGDSKAYADGFAGLVVLVMLIIALPATLFANALIVPRHADEVSTYLLRGMILPAFFIAACVIYYSGFWDTKISPYLPRQVEKIQTAGGGRVDENTLESFFVVNDYQDSAEEQDQIEDYARATFARYSRESRDILSYTVNFYFVPKHSYDPLDDAASRERAVAVFRHRGGAETPALDRVR
jgi:hypothetical protein